MAASRRGATRPQCAAALLALVTLLTGAGGRPLQGAPGFPAGPPDEPPITNEDVVRMVMKGDPVERILERIEDSPVRFDLSADVLAELRIAGVPEKVIQAMITRARATTAPPASPAEEPAKRGWIEIAFEEEPGEPPSAGTIVLPKKVRLPGRSEEPEPIALAFIVVCTNPVHVPAFWKNSTPAPDIFRRHRVLFLSEGTAPLEGDEERGLVYLERPAAWRFETEAGIHRGYVGVAARLGADEHYGAAIAAPFEDLTVEEGLVTRIHVRLRSTGGGARPSGEGTDDQGPPAPGQEDLGALALATWRLRPSVEITGIDPPEPPSEEEEGAASPPAP